MAASFTLSIAKQIEAGLVASGKFDGSHACLALATTGGNVLVHSPHRQPKPDQRMAEFDHVQNNDRRLAWTGELAELQIGNQVTALCTGHLGDDERDVLLVGTTTHIMAYSVEDNTDLFYKEMRDGTHCITVGRLSWLPMQVAVVGGNCSVTLLDSHGTELFWTVMRNTVTALAIFDFDGDGDNELLIGSQDNEIKVQKDEAVLWEVKESAPVRLVVPFSNRQFACAVGAGVVGVYEGMQRMWRGKSKHSVTSMQSFDVNGDGVLELVTGWSNGKIDARSANTGDVIFRIKLTAGIAGIVDADYRKTGKADLVVVTTNGEVRGYNSGFAIIAQEPVNVLRELLTKKQSLQQELRQKATTLSSVYMGCELGAGIQSKIDGVRLTIASGPGQYIYAVLIFAEGLFEGETYVSHPSKPQGELEIVLKPPQNEVVGITFMTILGTIGADLLSVSELHQELPPFCMYELIYPPSELPKDFKEIGVQMEIPERPRRIIMWLSQCFILDRPLDLTHSSTVDIWMRGLRDGRLHRFHTDVDGKTKIFTNDITLAADLIQSMAQNLGIRELTAEATFPADEELLANALEKVKELKEIETRLEAESAGDSTLLKNLVVRLEDARILENVDDMRRRLARLQTINGELIRQHEIRMKSQQELASTLKQLNVGVQNAAKLRVGKAAANVISRCRNAIQDGNPKALVLAMKNG